MAKAGPYLQFFQVNSLNLTLPCGSALIILLSQDELARLEAQASMVSDSSEYKESGNDSDTSIIKDVDEGTIDKKI